MTEEPRDGTEASVTPGSPDEGRPPVHSTELVLPERRPPVPAPRRWAAAARELRHRLPELRRHPAVAASASAAAAVGSALLVNGLRHALQQAEAARHDGGGGNGTGRMIAGYIVHEVHVIHHHVVHEIRSSSPSHQ